jgi:hypothetical protein
MESGESREKYKIKTKYRLRAGGYGRYNGITAIDCEEIIRANSVISEEEMQKLRPIHWLIWFGWNHGFLKPLWKLAHKKFKINPIDIILRLSNFEEQKNEEWKNLLIDFHKDSSSEWFKTKEELEKFYEKSDFLEDKEFDHFLKAEFKYNAKILLNKKLYSALIDQTIDLIKSLSSIKVSEDYWKNIKDSMINSMCFPEDIYNNRNAESKIITVESEFCKFFLNLNNDLGFKNENIKVKLYKNEKDLNVIIKTMAKNHFEKDKIRSVVKTLGSNANAFSFKKTINLENEETREIITTFHNDDGMVHHKFN